MTKVTRAIFTNRANNILYTLLQVGSDYSMYKPELPEVLYAPCNLQSTLREWLSTCTCSHLHNQSQFLASQHGVADKNNSWKPLNGLVGGEATERNSSLSLNVVMGRPVGRPVGETAELLRSRTCRCLCKL